MFAKGLPIMDTGTTAVERWLAAIVESSDDAIIGESLDGVVTSWNRSAERMFGYSASEAVGSPLSSLTWPPTEHEDDLDLIRRVRRGERVDHYETVRVHKNGTKILVSISMSPVSDSTGTLIGVAKIARDITTRVSMERWLLASNEKVRLLTEQEAQARAASLADGRFRELIENAPDGVLQIDTSGKIALANRAAEILFGYTREEFSRLSVDELVPEGRRVNHAKHRANFVEAGVSRPMGLGLNLSGRRKDGTEFPVEISLSHMNTPNGVHVTAVVRDVTERKHMEEKVRALQQSYMAELEARQKQAERLNQLKNEFLASVSHELRTPLHTIIGFSDLLSEELEGPLNPTQRDFVSHIRRDSDHLLGLINDLLDLSRIESGRLELHVESLSLRTAISEAVSAIRSHADEKAVRVVEDNIGDLRIAADPIRLRQILYNLLNNAVKFTTAGGEVSVYAEQDGGVVRVTVADTGVGIPTDEQPKIFDRFYQVSNKGGGAGLGLAISKQLVELQGGSISVESEPGRGSRFQFDLPTSSL